MAESFQSRLLRLAIPWLYPPVGRTGVRVTYISADYLEVRITLPLNRKTRNIVGTIFGGSLYAAVDPFYMSMLMKQLGKTHAVWDKSASIRFLKPGRSSLFATFRIEDAEVQRIRDEVAKHGRTEVTYNVQLRDANDVMHAEIVKVIAIKSRSQNGSQAAVEAAPEALVKEVE
jgi:acyl-coenzyme A thioesterase PaaI-like protein